MSQEIPTSPVVHNESKSRFEMKVGEQFAVAEYRREGDRMLFTHTRYRLNFEGTVSPKESCFSGSMWRVRRT
jgi:hypothetical protein